MIKKRFDKLLIYRCICILIISLLFFLYGYLTFKSKIEYISIFDGVSHISTELRSGDFITQEFETNSEYVRGISLMFSTNETSIYQGKVNIQIVNEDSETIIDQSIDARHIKDGKMLNILFDANNVILLPSTKYILQLKFEGIDGQSIALYLMDELANDECQLSINGETISSDLIISGIRLLKNDIFYKLYFAIMFIIVLCTIIVLVYLTYDLGEIWKLYLFVGSLLGIIYLFFIPLYVVPDEHVHICTAYKASNTMMGKVCSDSSLMIMRENDYNNGLRTTGIDRSYYNQYFNRLDSLLEEGQSEIEVIPPFRTIDTERYLYYVSALGITIGRLLRLDTIPMLLLGRFFNLLLFVSATGYALKKIPFGKTVVFAWALLPMLLQQVASFSYDCPIYAMSIIIISLSLHIAYNDDSEIDNIEEAILILCEILLAPVKKFALLPICFFPVIIFLVKKDKKSMYNVGRLLLIVLLVCLGNKIVKNLGLDLVESASSNIVKVSLKHLLTKPRELYLLLCNTIYRWGDGWIGAFLGYSLGWFEMYIPRFSVLPFMILLLFSGIRNENEKILLPYSACCYMIAVSCIIFGFAIGGALIGWTTFGAETIDGVQGRYALPAATLLFLALKKGKISKEARYDKIIILWSVWQQLVVMLFLFKRLI